MTGCSGFRVSSLKACCAGFVRWYQ